MNAAHMRNILRPHLNSGLLRPIDLHFAMTVARLTGTTDERVHLAVALASRTPGAGHICTDLESLSDQLRQSVREQKEKVGEEAAIALTVGNAQAPSVTDSTWPASEEWRAALVAAPRVVSDGGSERRPLVLDGSRLYLDRYWRYEQRLVTAIMARATVENDEVDRSVLRDGLSRLFGKPQESEIDWQRVAACVSVLRRFAVITGGPGTGKTTTIVRILALLVEQSFARGNFAPRIALAAPTGKAAARMMDAIRRGVETLGVEPRVARCIPTEAKTVHRLLGYDGRHPTKFRHDANRLLDADVVVVDEASMVDLALLSKLVDAVPPEATLLLIGDRNQLASVEAGALLGDIVPEDMPGFSPVFAARVHEVVQGVALPTGPRTVDGLHNGIVQLSRSHRYTEHGAIGELARAINVGDSAEVLRLLRSGATELEYHELDPTERSLDAHREVLVDGYRPYLAERTPERMLAELDKFRVLCAHREGTFGADGVNKFVLRQLAEAGLIAPRATEEWWNGRPFLVTQNDYQLDVFNGDTGVIVHDAQKRPRAWLRGGEDNGLRSVVPARLPAHQTVFAMTVHKAQGSEYDHVVLVLPQGVSRVVTRELLYTGISRARRRVTVVAAPEVIVHGVVDRVQRSSGVRDRLWG